jgi:hypothetical protein
VCIDPFAGTASAGTTAVASGVEFAGIEAHPLIAELAQLKFARPGQPGVLERVGRRVVTEARCSGRTMHRSEPELVTRCFSEAVLDVLTGLRNAVEGLGDDNPWQKHAKWALLATLRDVASVKVGWPYQRPALPRKPSHAKVEDRFLARLGMMAADLTTAPDPLRSRVIVGDSRLPATWAAAMGESAAAASVSSPPYLNNFDYADATRLELFFLAEAVSWKEMCDRVRSGMLVATTQQARKGAADAAIEALSVYPATGKRVREITNGLERERRKRGRGKEYDRMIPLYFRGMAQVLACLYDSLEPGGRAAWVVGDSAPYGVVVDTPALILQLASELGFSPLEDRLLRARGQRWRTNGSRHQVALTERVIVFQRPKDIER